MKELEIDEAGDLRLRRDDASLRKREGQHGRRAGRRKQGRKIETVLANVMDALIPLLRGDLRLFGVMRIGMRHRTQLGEEQRQRGNERNAKLEARFQSWQGTTRNSTGQS